MTWRLWCRAEVVGRYLRALAAFYVRLTFDAIDVFETLEPMLDDFRKLRFRSLGVSRDPSFDAVQLLT